MGYRKRLHLRGRRDGVRRVAEDEREAEEQFRTLVNLTGWSEAEVRDCWDELERAGLLVRRPNGGWDIIIPGEGGRWQ